MENNLANFTDILSDEIPDSQPMSLTSIFDNNLQGSQEFSVRQNIQKPLTSRPLKHAGQHGEFRSIEEIDPKYREVFTYPFFNLVQSRVIEDALYSDKSMVVCAPTGSGKTVAFEMAIVQLLMEIEDKNYDRDFKIIYMAPVKALCTERLTEWYPKFTKLGMMCIEVTGDTDVDFNNLKPYKVIITTPEKWDMMTRRWRDHRGLVEMIKLFLIDEVHILNDDTRGPVLEAVVSRMKTIESSTQSEYRIEQLQRQYQGTEESLPTVDPPPRIRFVAVSATVSNPEDVAAWLGNSDKPAVYYKFGDECRPVKLKKVVEGYPCPDGTSIFKFDIILNYKLWPIIQKYHNGKPTLIFCNTRKSVTLTAEALSREITISFNPEQRAKLMALATSIKNKKLQALVLAGVGCHHAGLLFEERLNIENAFRNRDLPILITTTTLAMGVNLPAHLVIIKNTQQYVNGAYQEYSISTVLQMVGRAGRPQFDTEATAVIMTRATDKPRYEALVCGSEPLQSYLHKRLPENLNSEAALGTVKDVAQCVQWLRSTFLYVRAAKDPKRYLGLPNNAPLHLISKKIEELCVRAMNGLASAGLITMDEASCIESTEAGRLMSVFYLDLVTMKHIMKIEGTATLEQVLWVVCESHELSDMHLRVDERRCLNALNRNNNATTIRFPMKGKISTRQMKLNCIIQAVLGCLPIPDPSINQEAMKIMRIADRVCKCLVAYMTRPDLISGQPVFFSAVLNSLILSKCVAAHLWENSHYVSKQLKGIGPTFSTLLATAGKINFMILEESHPRDLERIMNKGPPAGNVLRKQISLLPKYQITMTPVDEKVVSMELTLLNHHYLAENMENLTAGERHKSYIIAGDSENHLLLLTSFQDKDLIGMYDGKITHEIKRIHSFEHKITAHCVSSKFVGIDAQCEYVFKDLESAPMNIGLNSCYFNKDIAGNRATQRQTYITDVYKQRKRRNNVDSAEICQSKEKKKRESVLAEKIRLLKESFGKTTKCVKEELHKSAEMSNKVVQDILRINDSIPVKMDHKLSNPINNTTSNIVDLVSCDVDNGLDLFNNLEKVNYDDFEGNVHIDDSKINDILNDIESEISKEEKNVNPSEKTSYNKFCDVQKINTFKRPIVRNHTNFAKKNKKSNFNFMESLDKNNDILEEEECKPITDTGFSETIKSHINKYLQDTRSSTKTNNSLIENLIGNEKRIDLEYMEKDNNDDMPLVKLNSDNLVKYTNINESNMNVIPKHNSVLQSGYTSAHTKSEENMVITQDLPFNKSVIPLYTKNLSEVMDYCNNCNNNDNISKLSFTKNSRNTLNENNIGNNDRNVSLVPIEEFKNNTTNEKKIDNEYTRNPRELKIQNIPQINIALQHIYDKNPSVEKLIQNNEKVISKNFDRDYRYTDNYDELKETKKAENQSSYIKNFKYSAMNVDISTCYSANRQVHIIKKMKLDVDVTEIATCNDIKSNTNNDFENCENTLFPYIPQNNYGKLDESPLICLDKSLCQILEPTAHFNDDYTPQKYGDINKNIGEKPDTCTINFEKSVPEKNTDSATRILEVKEEEKTKENEVRIEKLLSLSVITPKIDTKLDVDINLTNNNSKSNTQASCIAQDNTVILDKYFSICLNSSDKLFSVQNNDNNVDAKKSNICSTSQEKPVNEENKNNSQYISENKEYANSSQTPKPVLIENKTSFERESDLKENPKNISRTLGSILQKYSRVIRKNKNEDEKIVNTKIPQTNSGNSRNEQNIRPFKITEIDKIEPKYPLLLITEHPKCINSHQLPQLPTLPIAETLNYSSPIQIQPLPISETPKYLSQDKVLNKNIEKSEVVPEFPSIVASGEYQISYNDDVIPDDLESMTPNPSKDFTITDFKLDDSMLNPKTLLQCLINDEPEIIPPPPEFSDLNYSPPQTAEKDYNNTHESELEVEESDNNEYRVFYDNSTKHRCKDFGKKQFHSNSSNEIETLLLSNEDYSERKPWIITQSPAYKRNVTPTGYTARRANLNQFKFTNKKKFKMK